MISRPAMWGRLSVVGAVLAALIYIVDQVHKWYMISIFDISRYQPVKVVPGFDLVMVWNYGISYGWFASHSQATRWILIVLSVAVAVLLWIWLARQTKPLVAAAIGLVLGGALANATDRLVHGAVADFFHLYVAGFSWYVFNIADVAIVAGVLVLMYDSLMNEEKQTDK
ncbi:MAG: signal peptidase II [Pseudomonadota bacterium]